MVKAITTMLILLIIPLASAFPCHLTADDEYCQTIADSGLNESSKDALFSSLLYPDSDFPNHGFIEGYNLDIIATDPPYNTTINNSVQIKNAWMSFLVIFPAVIENNTLYVIPDITALSEYNYDVYVPPDYVSPGYSQTSKGDCQRTHRLVQNEASLKYYHDYLYKATGKISSFSLGGDGAVRSQLQINTMLEVKHWRWHSYCCRWYKGHCKKRCHVCKYSHTTHEPDSMRISESKNVTIYTEKPTANLTVTNQYLDTTKGVFTASNYTYFRLRFNESSMTRQTYYYDLIFDKKPYYFAYLEAHNFSRNAQKNIRLGNDTFFVKNPHNCSLFAYNHFHNFSSGCDLTLHQEEVEELSIKEKKADLSLLWYTLIFLLVIYIIYRIVKSQARKITLPIIIILLVLIAPMVTAQEAEEEECGITNLASCLPAKMYDYLLYILNAPLLPLLNAVKDLLTAEVSTDLFHYVWNVIRYILSFFYVFFFLYAGYVFLTSNANPIKRAHAKEMLQNTVIMIVLIQGSFYIYGLLLSISSVMDAAILNMIDPHFFMITADNIINIGLEFIFTMSYALVLFITMLMLVLRYIIVSFGVVLFPFGLFCYFTPPLKGYGRFILNVLGIFIFITFIDMLIILACSLLITHPVFANFKIVVMINCFSIVNYTLWLAIKFALTKSSMGTIKDDIQQTAKYIAMLA